MSAVPSRFPDATAIGFLILLLSGCSSTRERAEERRVLVEVGMTGREVQQRIGRPSKVFSVEPAPGIADQTVEVWAYTMKIPPDLGDAVTVGLNAGALVILCVATKGNDSTLLNAIKIPNKGRCAFWVGFGADGRVRGVTNLEEVR